jgi:hypothetical protein
MRCRPGRIATPLGEGIPCPGVTCEVPVGVRLDQVGPASGGQTFDEPQPATKIRSFDRIIEAHMEGAVSRLRSELVAIGDEMTLLTSAGGDIYAAI